MKGEYLELNYLYTVTVILKCAVNNAEIITSNYAVLNSELEWIQNEECWDSTRHFSGICMKEHIIPRISVQIDR
jgi:hypothetical protein